MGELAELEGADDVTVVRRVSQLLPYYQDLVTELSRMRREALERLLRTLHPDGDGMWTYRQLGELSTPAISPERIRQLVASGPKPERALIGTGFVTVAVGSKPEGPRQNPSAMVSQEALAASRMIEDTAGAYGLKSTQQIVEPPGLIDLNRTNLVVIGSPRLLPYVSQVLAADPHHGFGHGATGWYLTEHGEKRKSPADSGDDADLAYIGRLPRPDSRGSFLYLAGIHAMGTKGAAAYFTSHVTELYEQVGRRRWSVLLRCDYDPDTRAVLNVEPITPIHTF